MPVKIISSLRVTVLVVNCCGKYGNDKLKASQYRRQTDNNAMILDDILFIS